MRWCRGRRADPPDASATVPYRRRFESKAAWTALDAVVEDDALRIAGTCPGCKHDLDDFVSLSPEWLAGLKRGEAALIERVTACNCEDEHRGRPETAKGCGAIAVVTVQLGRGDDGLVATVIDARPATARDRSWDDEATRWDHEMSERVASVAEKWGQTIGALFGIVGVSLVLSDDAVAAALASEVRWPWWVLGGVLAGIFLAALYGWLRREPDEPADDLMVGACAISLAAALVVLLWGAIDEPPVDAGPTFGILAAISVAFALAATGFAGLAAQGSPKWVNYLTGNRMRRLRMESADRSARNLRRARIATVVAVGGLVATLAVFWYAPATPEVQQVQVTTVDGSRLCGALLEHKGAGVAFDPPGPEQQRRVIPPDQLAGLTAVKACK